MEGFKISPLLYWLCSNSLTYSLSKTHKHRVGEILYTHTHTHTEEEGIKGPLHASVCCYSPPPASSPQNVRGKEILSSHWPEPCDWQVARPASPVSVHGSLCCESPSIREWTGSRKRRRGGRKETERREDRGGKRSEKRGNGSRGGVWTKENKRRKGGKGGWQQQQQLDVLFARG